MSVSLTWREGEHRSIDARAISAVLAEVAAASSVPVIVVLEIEGAALSAVRRRDAVVEARVWNPAPAPVRAKVGGETVALRPSEIATIRVANPF